MQKSEMPGNPLKLVKTVSPLSYGTRELKHKNYAENYVKAYHRQVSAPSDKEKSFRVHWEGSTFCVDAQRATQTC